MPKEKDSDKKFDAMAFFDKVLDVLYIVQSILSIVLPILNAIYQGIQDKTIARGRPKDVEKDLRGLPDKILMTFGKEKKTEKENSKTGD